MRVARTAIHRIRKSTRAKPTIFGDVVDRVE
jgi:hypothetical protein